MKIISNNSGLRKNTQDNTLIVEDTENYVYVGSEYGLSKLRNTIVEENGGTVVNPFGTNYYTSTTGTDPNGKAGIETKSLCRYELNGQSDTSVALIPLAVPTGNQFISAGMTDKDLNDGWYFLIDSSGVLKIRTIRNGVVIFDVSQPDFNVDKLDGNGSSGINWSPLLPLIYQIRIVAPVSNVQYGINSGGKFFPVHTITFPANVNEIQRYTQRPICINVDNNGETTSLSVLSLIAYNLISNPTYVVKRITPITQTAIGTAYGVGTWTPIFSIRRKSTLPSVILNLQSLNTLQTAPTIYGLFLNTPLTGPSWGSVIETDNNETGLEFDESATAMSLSSSSGDGVVKIFSILGEGIGTQLEATSGDLTKFKLTLGLNDHITLGAISLLGAGTCKCILNVEELW